MALKSLACGFDSYPGQFIIIIKFVQIIYIISIKCKIFISKHPMGFEPI